MPEKHISRKNSWDEKKWEKGETNDPSVIDDFLEVQDRAITFKEKVNPSTKEKNYHKQVSDFKDGFGNTAQYLKFIKAHLAEKKLKIEKLQQDKENFEKQIASLNPSKQRSKSELDQINYKEIKADDVRKVLEYVKAEREEIKEKIKHFSSQIQVAKKDLEEKERKVEEVKDELNQIQFSPPSQEIETENDAIDTIQKELKSVRNDSESEKIFGAINSLVVLLNSKNQATLNELNSVKEEFNKMKRDYDKVMKMLKEKNTK